MNRVTPIAFAFAILLAFVRCSGWFPPFESVPPASPAGESEAVRVAVCYNPLTASKVQVRAIAVQSCGTGSSPQRIGRDLNLEHCPVLIPERATFACGASSEGTAPGSAAPREETAPGGATPSEERAPGSAAPSEGKAPGSAGNNQR